MERKSRDEMSDALQYAIRLTFGIVHGVVLTLASFILAFWVPSFSQFLFGLYGCVLAPLLSFFLTGFCNICIAYVSQVPYTVQSLLRTIWIPPVGIWIVSLIILPLEMMPSLGFTGPLSTLVVTSIIVNFFIATLLQLYAAREIQFSSSEDSESSASSLDPTNLK
jgi:hypothetical protein